MRRKSMLAALLLVVTATGVHAADVGFRGWGPRVGLQSDPDQVIGGAHFDLGEFIEHLRWQPSVEIGFGDDIVSFFGNFMVSYYFPVDAKVTPYAGAQVQAWLFDFDEDGDADFDADFDGDLDDGFNAEIGLDAVGGIETKLKSGTRFLAELQVGIGDVPEIRVLAGWTF